MNCAAIRVGLLLVCALGARAQCGPRMIGAPNFRLHSLEMTGVDDVPPADVRSIRAALLGRCFENRDDFSGILRDQFQRRGFFKAKVGELKVKVAEGGKWPPAGDITAHIVAGAKYTLKAVKITPATTEFSESQLRALVPLHDDDVFDIEGARKGILNLRHAFGRLGYINFTPVPDTQVDEEHDSVQLDIDMDIGKQYHVGTVTMFAPAELATSLAQSWPLHMGDVYDFSAVDRFFAANRRFLPKGAAPEYDLEVRQNNDAALVFLTVTLCPPQRTCEPMAIVPR